MHTSPPTHLRVHLSPLIRQRAPAAIPQGPLCPKTWTAPFPASQKASESAYPKPRKREQNATLRNAPPGTRTRTDLPARRVPSAALTKKVTTHPTSGISPLSSIPPLVSARQRCPMGTTPHGLQTLVPFKPPKGVQGQCVLCGC